MSKSKMKEEEAFAGEKQFHFWSQKFLKLFSQFESEPTMGGSETFTF
jgi:hypothetical protein